MQLPREVPSWDSYFLNLAEAVSLRSKDPSTQHGALVVDEGRRILGTGYNGGARGIPDGEIDWSRPNKYAFVLHAEENALWMARRVDLAGCTLYVTGPPCSRCMLRIVHAGIRTVIHSVRGSACVDVADLALSHRIARLAGAHVCEVKP